MAAIKYFLTLIMLFINIVRASGEHRANTSEQFLRSFESMLERSESIYQDYLELSGFSGLEDALNVSQGARNVENEDFCSLSANVKRQIVADLDAEMTWEEYKIKFGKSYLDARREAHARAAWARNAQLVREHNVLGASFALHLNHLADLDLNGYLKRILKLVETKLLPDPAQIKDRNPHHDHHGPLPDQFDWREKGFRPKLEEQRRCGACYAFSIAHMLQAQLYRKHRTWKDLSVQQIVDCSGVDGNLGCGGGSLRAGLRYASRAGLELEEDYPYHAKKGLCNFRPMRVAARAKHWGLLRTHDEQAMQRALVMTGPLAVAINASPHSFQLYRFGIYEDPRCSSKHVNHAMLLVGYTRHSWVLLNWWGRKWGENGYMRIRRGRNTCGIANSAAYAEIF